MIGDAETPGNGLLAWPRRSTCRMPAIIGEVVRLQHKPFEADLGRGGRLRPCRVNAQSGHRGTRPPPLEKLFVPGKDRIVSAVRKLPGRDAE